MPKPFQYISILILFLSFHFNGFADAADALNVTIGLVRRGYSEKDIEKIWGGNFIRVFQEAERQAKK